MKGYGHTVPHQGMLHPQVSAARFRLYAAGHAASTRHRTATPPRRRAAAPPHRHSHRRGVTPSRRGS